jgi:hypothetical protein
VNAIYYLLFHSIPGARSTLLAHIARGNHIHEAIRVRWGICGPERWQVKHLRWFLTSCEARGYSPTKTYHYWLTIRTIVAALDRLDHWEPHLRGPWLRNGVGGRPPKLPRCARKSQRRMASGV